MTQKDLFPLFPTSNGIPNKVLLVSNSQLHKLQGKHINGCRIFLLVYAGELQLEVSHNIYKMKAGSLLDLLDTTGLTIQSVSQDIKAHCMIPNYEFARESLKMFKPGPENYILDRLEYPILNLTEQEISALQQQMILMESALTNTNHTYRYELALVYFKSFMLEIGHLTLTHKNEMEEKATILSKRDLVMMEFMKLVWEYACTEHEVEYYADKLCLSAKHLTRLVKEAISKTPHEIISDELLKYAMKKLEDDEVTVGQLAEEMHFADQASFSKFFKKHTKISPMEYRRQLKKME